MSTVRWLDENNGIALWSFSDGDTMEDIMADFRTFNELITSVDRKTYSIIDLTEFRSMPSNTMSYYPEMAKLAPKGDQRSEVIAVITQRRFVTITTDIFTRVYPHFKERFIHFPTLDEAVEYIYERIRESAA